MGTRNSAKSATSRASTKSTAKPAPKKNPVCGTRTTHANGAKPTEESPGVATNSRKRKQKGPVEEPADITADPATLAQFQAWQAQLKLSDAAREKAAKAAKDKCMCSSFLQSFHFSDSS